MVKFNLKEIDKKWQEHWEKEHAFRPTVDTKRKKCFITVPIPYPSGSMHLGHLFTWARADIYARFMRMLDYNVLFPQGFHFTGGPIVGMSEKIRQNDPATIEAFRKQGVAEADLKVFGEDPKKLAEYFSLSFIEDFKNTGMSIDWSRTFITSSLNPYFSKFVEWQFNKLRSKGLIYEGRHPVVWCPNENTPLGDHDRAVGEGESPIKFSVIKFRSEKFFFPVATLRPETIFGVTNLWVNKNVTYCIAEVNGNEKWVVSEEAISKLENQLNKVRILDKISGERLIGLSAENPLTNENVLVISADFVDKAIGTGVVMSVPMHAPFDYFYLNKIKSENPAMYSSIKPKKIIIVPGQENLLEMAIKEFGTSDSGLKAATKKVYKIEFNLGIMSDKTSGLEGIPVKGAEKTVTDLLDKHKTHESLYELTGRVVCRCGTEGTVKILDKQWFIRYSDKEWKTKTMKLIENLKTYPQEIKLQLLNTLEWLDDKAAARTSGLGTPLPWDKKWIIEPLSDSTIYMAYYTIADNIEKMNIEDINDATFDYIFSETEKDTENELVKEMKDEFNYWYPLDMRVSAKELLQNHFIFFLMNHAAIFDEKNWPRSIGINGWLTVNGEKLSKSKGATLTIKKGLEDYGADELRMIAAAGNGMDDVEWDPDTINTFEPRFEFVAELMELKKTFESGPNSFDAYLNSRLIYLTEQTKREMENFRYGAAMSHSFFELYNEIKAYMELGGNDEKTVRQAVMAFIKLNHPFFPHITSEIYSRLNTDGSRIQPSWEDYPSGIRNEVLENEVAILRNTIDDIKNVLRLIKRAPKKITLEIAGEKKFELYNKVVAEARRTKNTNEIRKTLRTSDKLLDKLLKNVNRLPEKELNGNLELKVLEEGKNYLEKAFGCKVEVSRNTENERAVPGKPAINII